ncbi:F-box only protein 2-like [Pseudophryne corroboree]|uniref:F-box only protein 2-like n=1 Tax=Pseudophryne corroboree TaxID=495146 RepID=UPI00308210BB
MARNLIKNPCGNEGLQHWTDIQNGGGGWKVEDAVLGATFPSSSVKKYFATSNGWCSKSQDIDLLKEGYTKEILDTNQPCVVISEWYGSRADTGSSYELTVQLLGDKHQVIAEYKSGRINIAQPAQDTWHQIGNTFSNYGPGVRYIRFKHGGQDAKSWQGWYGVRLTKSSVTIEV